MSDSSLVLQTLWQNTLALDFNTKLFKLEERERENREINDRTLFRLNGERNFIILKTRQEETLVLRKQNLVYSYFS